MQMPFQPRPHWIAFGFRTPFAHRAAQTRPRPWQQLAATMAAQQQPAQLASIFRRGSKQEVPGGPASSGDDPDALEQQLAQLAVAWAAPKASRGLAVVVWRPQLGAFEVTTRGRQTFNGQGFMHSKKLYLHAEEAVFMLDQAEVLLFIEQPGGQQRLLTMQEALHMLAVLGVDHGRLLTLAHLSRLGYVVKRHPACWVAPAEQPAAVIWQRNPAWSHTDGLLPLAQQQQPAAAHDAGKPTAGGGTSSAAEQEQQGQLSESARKKRKLADAPALQQQQQQQQQQPQGGGCWWPKVPAWLQGTLTAEGGASVADTLVPQLLGLQLQQQFPVLQPLPAWAPGAHDATPATADLVFDGLLAQARLSYKAPPAPEFSIAMPRPGCSQLPRLHELLRLSGAAVGAPTRACSTAGGSGGTAAAAGTGAAAAAAVRFAVPDGGDVNFYEVQPVALLNLLTNRHD